MKILNDTAREVVSSGYAETATMMIKATAQSFRNLVDNIYSKKEETVVRELIANALDSHARAGIDRPITVGIPTIFEPNFYVRDYGVGMTHEFIMRHYSTLFESTKTDTNGETGMFGIGSKSPLALVDAFTLIAYDGTERRIYEISIPSEGVPTIGHTITLPDDAPRGIEVRVPLDQTNVNGIINGLANQHFSWFDKNIDFDTSMGTKESIRRFGNITKLTDRIYLGTASSSTGTSWAIEVRQGAAVYPLDRYSVSGLLSSAVMSLIQTLSEMGRTVMVDLPIGTCAVTMSREAIQYDAQSARNIADTLDLEVELLKKQLHTIVDGSTNYVEAIERLTDEYCEPDSAHTLQDKRYMRNLAHLVPDSIVNQSSTAELNEAALGCKVWLHRGSIYAHYSGGVPIVELTQSTRRKLTVDVVDVVYVLPKHIKWHPRVKAHVEKLVAGQTVPAYSSNGYNICVVRTARRNVQSVVDYLKEQGVYSEHFGESDLPTVGTVAPPKVGPRYKRSDVNIWMGSSVQWSGKQSVEKDDAAYYVVKRASSNNINVGVDLPNSTKILSYTEFGTVYKDALALGILDAELPVYRLSEIQAATLKNPQWINLIDVVTDAVHAKAETHADDMAIQYSEITSRYSDVGTLLHSIITYGDEDIQRETLRLMERDEGFAIYISVPYYFANSAAVYKLSNLSSAVWKLFPTLGAREDKHAELYTLCKASFPLWGSVSKLAWPLSAAGAKQAVLALLQNTQTAALQIDHGIMLSEYPELTNYVNTAKDDLAKACEVKLDDAA